MAHARLIPIITSLITSLVIAGLTLTAKAQSNKAQPNTPPSAEHAALARMQGHYEQGGNLTAKFTQTYTDRLRGKKRRESGKLWVARDGRVRWSYLSPQRKDFVFDGKTAYFYEPDNAQVTVFDHFEDSQLSAAMHFLWGRGEIVQRFEVRACNSMCAHAQAPTDAVVELVPKKPIPTVKLLTLVIDKAGYVSKTILLDPLDNRTEYQFSDLTFGVPITASTFAFAPPEGVSVLRATLDKAP